MPQNVYLPVQDLKKAPVKPGGLCSLVLFKWDDVLLWPAVNPLTGIIDTAIQLKAGGFFYLCQAVEKGRTFTEEDKSSDAGTFTDVSVTARLAGNTSNNTLSVATMRYHQWGIILYDRDGNPRLVGNNDSGARLLTRYSPEDISGSRGRDLKWNWSSPVPLPLYTAKAFPLNIGGVQIVAGTLRLLLRFQVGAPAAPMVHGQALLTDVRFGGKKLLFLVDGWALPCDDSTGAIDFTNSIVRHYKKTLAQSTLTVPGGVIDEEIIEIYEVS